MSYLDTIKKLEDAALHPARTVAATVEETGRKAFGCFPIYTPEEIIYAAGYVPVGMWGGKTDLKLADKYLQSFCCSIMRSNLEYGLKGTYHLLAGAIIPTFCDTLKCLCENWKIAVPDIPAVPVVYPQNRKLPGAKRYLTAEFKRIQGLLEKMQGCAVSEEALENAWRIYEAYRAAMREFVKAAAGRPDAISARSRHLLIKAGYFMDKQIYTDAIREITEGLLSKACETKSGLRAVLTGYIGEPVEILDILDENGISVASDDLAHESRQFRVAGGNEGDAVARMADRILGHDGCTFLYDEDKRRGENLVKAVREGQADAVIVFMMKFCDPEEFDYPIYKKELEAAGIPLLYLETEQQMDSFEQVRTRIQSFAEMLI